MPERPAVPPPTGPPVARGPVPPPPPGPPAAARAAAAPRPSRPVPQRRHGLVRRRTLTIGAAATVASGALMGWFAVDALGDSSSAAVTSSTSTSARSDQTASTPVFGTPSDTFDTTSGGS